MEKPPQHIPVAVSD